MISLQETESEKPKEGKLRRRDWILLPLVSLLTICAFAGGLELTARGLFPIAFAVTPKCMVIDPSWGYRGVPNTACREQWVETPPIEYRFNNCGDRSDTACRPKPPGTYRIVVVGSSMVFGLGVPGDKIFTALLPGELSQQTGRSVEVYNKGLLGAYPPLIAPRMDAILADHPDMILWAVASGDVSRAAPALPEPADPGFLGQSRYRIRHALATEPLPVALEDIQGTLFDLFSVTRSKTLVQHYLYQSRSEYVRLFLKGGDSAGFLRTQPDAEWTRQVQAFGGEVGDLEERCKAAGVPLYVVLLPDRVQTAMISMGEWPSGYDPYHLDRELDSMVTSRGAHYIDILPDYRGLESPEEGYFPSDGHPNIEGHALLARFIAKELAGGAVPGLDPAKQLQIASAHTR